MVDDRTALMSARALAPGYEVLWYTIDRVLGQGGFGITYLAHDRNLDRAVAIKEYLPTTFAYRHEDYSVKPITGDHRENFVWGLGSFLKEAQTLARFGHPNVVRVHSVFEENNTAYMVMEYEHGQNLATIFKQNQNLNQAFFEQIFFPIFDGLKEIHKFDFIHRDIKPANIYIREDGTPVLIDFGSARQTTQQQTSEITTLVSQGYTPLEQYSANYGDQGPWTDIYALAATIYEGIVGRKPDESLSRSACMMRSKPDLLERLDARVYTGFSQQFLNAVFAGLKLEPELRPQSIEAWSALFSQTDQSFESPAGFDSGFTELEDDRTRLQQRAPSPSVSMSDFDAFTEIPANTSGVAPGRTPTSRFSDTGFPSEGNRADTSASYRPAPGYSNTSADFENTSRAYTSREHTAVSAPPYDDLLSFDADDLDTDSRSRTEKPTGNTSRTSKVGSAKKKGSGLTIAAVAVVALLGAGGAYYFMSGGISTPGITAATLSDMPRPAQVIPTVLLKEGVLEQLDNLAKLAPLQAQAYALNADDTELVASIRRSESTLLSLAKQWNASVHGDIADSIRQVSDLLPAAVHDRNRVQGILSAAGQVSVSTQVLALMDEKRYLSPAGDSVLDKISSVSANDYQQLKSSAQWSAMMDEFSTKALEKLSQSRFDDVARITEAALTIDAENTGFITLRDFLTSQR